MADLIYKLQKAFPGLFEQLRQAHIRDSPEIFIKKTLRGALTFSVGLTIFMFFMLSLFKISTIFLPFIFIGLFLAFFLVLVKRPVVNIKKRMRALDKEVLFAGRFLLVKIHSGRPLLNALVDASQSYGIASEYFKEIVDDVNMGTPIEQALDNAVRYSPSDKFRRIVFQISNAIKIGIDISDSLNNAIEEISHEQLIEIQKYGKKLNGLSMFYMLLAVVMPSLGVAMFIVIGSLTGIFKGDTAIPILFAVCAFLIVIQFIFLVIFKSNRLTVNL
jgi:pilus assembly protein TadC